MADVVTETVGISPKRVHVLRHPVRLDQAVASQWMPAEPRRILYVSHLWPHKNHQWLLRVFAASRLAKEGVELWMTAPLEDWPKGHHDLVDVARRHRISEDVEFLPRISPDKVSELYREATVFAFPSLDESFGFPLVEALAHGVPIIALDSPIAREICGEAAQYLPSDLEDAAALMHNVLVKSWDELRWWSQLARNRAKNFSLSWPEWLRRLEGELEDLTGAND
jgi:glycosyltransferase involved in cell wall biosynthesis